VRPNIDKHQLLELLKRRSKRPMPFREIEAALGLRPAGRKALKRLLRELVASGEVVRTRKGLYGPAAEMELINGYYEAHRDGFGFIIQEKPGERDIFIPPRAAQSAMDGDRVLARIDDARRRTGRVVRVLERVHKRVAGKVEEVAEGVCLVRPMNKSLGFDIHIPPGQRAGAHDGQRVIVEIEQYPTAIRSAIGKIVKVIERPETPKADVESIMEEFGLPKRFSSEVNTEAKSLYEKKFGKRTDLTALNTVTIDGERARDFDDAVSIERMETGYRLWVHIADVGFYVGWDTSLDLEARRRGTSVYFPDRVIPMLPKTLSEDLCSLRPSVERPAFTVEMELDERGVRTGATFYPSLITSNERMTYTSVAKILVDREPEEREKYAYLLEDFELMGELAELMRKARFRRGSLDFDLPEPEVLLDMQGEPEAVIKAERNFAHFIIEEFMLAANEAVAGFLEGAGVPSLYRIHEEPDPNKADDVVRFARLVLRKPSAPRKLNKLIKAAQGTAAEEAIIYTVLRAMKQARYSPENVGHYGLAAETYTHFTSPIRRYPDLVVHRILREFLTSGKLSDKRKEELASRLDEIAFHSSHMERIADDAERTVLNAMRVWFMRDKVGEEFPGRVIGLNPYGMRIRLEEYYIEGFVHVSQMPDDYYKYDERSMSLRGRHRGQEYSISRQVSVRVDRVDLEEREILFGLIENGPELNATGT
jgi:ribonuclease R